MGMAFCPEERGIFTSLNVEENLPLPPVVREGGLTTAQVHELFPNLKERLTSQGTRLSGGEQQMLAIGRILRTGARMLLLDEPTEGLAPVIVHSASGRVLKAIRENEPRAISLGYDVDRYMLIAFILAAAISGLAGSTKAVVFQLAPLTDVHWNISGEVILMTLIGGVGRVFGPIAGAPFLTALENYLGQMGSWVTVVAGSNFIVCVLAFRRGIFGELGRVLKRTL
jgi:hypothetical protein